MIYDGGTVFAGHSDFGGRVTLGDSDGVSDHATHVAGTVGGDGSSSGGQHRGMAPNVDILSYGFEVPGGLQDGFLYTDPGDLEADYFDAFITRGADVANNSIGSNTEPNGFPCSWQGDYGVTAALLDNVVRGSLGRPILTLWAAGNERQGSRCDVEGHGDFYSIAPPQGAKNQISVGAINSEDDSMTSFSSWGPLDDGRLKPDIVGPGCQESADGGVTSVSSSGGYSVKCGTSMSSPTVTGIAALIVQDFRAQSPGEPMFRNSMLKVFLAHTAEDLGNPGPDYQHGYGSVRADAAIDFLRGGNFAEASVSQGQTFSAVAVVTAGDPELKITAAWDDAPGTANVNPSLVNDIDLVVTSPSGVRHYPWTLNPADPGAPAVRTVPDTVNNIEQVFVENPEPGVWLIDIVGASVPEGPQPVSLGVSPFLRNCTDAGVVSMVGQNFACSDTVEITLSDCGLNLDDNAIDTGTVLVTSTSDPAGVVLTVTETAEGAARFAGTVAISQSPAVGELLVSPGDIITVTYNDPDDGAGSPLVATATATVDCTPPVISEVALVDVRPRSATISFITNEPTTASVSFGTRCRSLDQQVSATGRSSQHTVTLTNLTDGQPYVFTVGAIDEAGNQNVANNNGRCFSFETPEVPDFFTAQYSGSFPLQNVTMTYSPGGLPLEFYTLCEEPASTLPVDPAGGTVISLSDDDSEPISLSTPVQFYGVPYNQVYVGSNGYLTFTEGDTDFSETYDDHFAIPRLSMVFDDLNPSAGGTVSYKEVGDGVVITYDAVEEFSTGNLNTFQVKLSFDGTIAVTYLAVNTDGGIAGLSSGGGTDPDFLDSLFGGYGACGPRPPVASGAVATTTATEPVDIVLGASDDGTPGGPLTFRITSLPASGFIADPNGAGNGLITSVPYQLAGNGNTVRYAPMSSAGTQDTFAYKVNDGGTPPDGGDSLNEGVVTVNIESGDKVTAYDFLVDDADPQWDMQGDWAFGVPLGNDDDPSSGFTGANVLGYNLAGDYTNNMPRTYLTSSPIDMTGVAGAEVTFMRWLGVESSTFDDASFEVSANGGSTWQVLYEHDGSSFTDSSWTEQSFDISSIADGQADVRLRWVMGATDGSVTYPGWNIDDVRILTNAPPSCSGDVNGDGTVGTADLLVMLSNYGAAAQGVSGGDLDDSGTIGTSDLLILLSAWGQSC
jgi:hypothetical protein